MFGAPVGGPLENSPFTPFRSSDPASNYTSTLPVSSQLQQQQQQQFFSVPPAAANTGSVFASATPFPATPGESPSFVSSNSGFLQGHKSVHNSLQKTEGSFAFAAGVSLAPSPLGFGAGEIFPGPPAVEVKSPSFSHIPPPFSTNAAPSAFLPASKTTTATQPAVTSAFGYASLPEREMSQPQAPSVFHGHSQRAPAVSQAPLFSSSPPPPSPSFPSAPVARTRKRRADDDESSQTQLMAEGNTESLERRSKANPQRQFKFQRDESKNVGSLSGKDQLLSVRVFAAFMGKILDSNESRREEASDILDKAFFGVVGSHGGSDFPTALNQMLSVWLTLKNSQTNLRGEYWVALFALGCHLNYITSTIISGDPGKDERKQGILDSKWSAISSACTYANVMCDICLQIFANQLENHAPFGVLPLILRRARNTFELANDEGVSNILPNIKTILLKLHRYVRVPQLKQEPSSVVDRQRAMAFANVLGEMMLHCCAPPESRLFVESFHKHCAEMVEARCTLYHHYAHNLLQEPLTDAAIHQAMELLARAFVIVPQSAAKHRRLLFAKLTACGLALGRLPAPDENEVEELKDLIVSVRSANLALFNIAMSNNSELYVRYGIHNVLQGVGKRIALLMVVKYYVVSGMSSRLPLQEMIDYYEMPLSLAEASHVWLLPLLVERRINGVIDHGVLILSGANPFDDYVKEKLILVAESIES